MTVAPMHAKASRQKSEGTPICDSPSTAWYPAIAAGTANAAATAARSGIAFTSAKAR